MNTSREQAAGPSIRLRYSRQFQSGGHAHTIDAESLLSMEASQETRAQVIRDLEASVEQLARQIVQRGSRPAEGYRAQTPVSGRAGQAPVALDTPRLTTPARTQDESERATAQRQTTGTGIPATPVPVSESMPTTPAARGETRAIRLPQFLKAINTHLGISPVEAMELLNVATLDGLNYWDAYRQLEVIIAQKNAGRANPSGRSTQQKPVVEAPRTTGQGMPPAPTSRLPSNQATTSAPGGRTQGQAALQSIPGSAQQTAAVTAPVPEASPGRGQEREKRQESETGVEFAGSPKAPIPIQIGTVRDLSSRSYKFEEEEDEEYELPEDEVGVDESGRLKLEELKEVRGTTTASAGRLKVLDNVVTSQISEEQLQKIIQAAWGTAMKKKLKVEQVEALISWAKEDLFEIEVEAVLAWIKGGEE